MQEAIIEMTFAYLLDRRCLDTWHVLSDDVIEDLSYEAADEALFEEEMKALHDHVLGTQAQRTHGWCFSVVMQNPHMPLSVAMRVG